MLQNIRDNSQSWVVKVIIAFIVISFAFFGVESIVSIGGNSATVQVNGKDLSDKQIAIETQAQIQQMLARMGEQADPSMIDEGRIKAGVIDRLIRTELLRQSAEEKGLYVSDAAVLANIGSNENFQEEGKFSQDQYQRLLRNYGLTHLEYSDLIATSMLLQQESAAVNAGAFVTPKEVELINSLQNQTRTFKYATFKIQDFKDDMEVSDEEIANYYENNQAKYMTNRQVNVAYVELQKDVIAAKMDATQEELEAEYSAFVDSLSAQEERVISHILIATNEDRDEAAAKLVADEVLGKLNAGEDFAALASEYSDDPGSKESGGSLGPAQKGVFVPEFEDAAYALTEDGQISPVTQTQYGFHIIKLDSLSTPEVPTFESERARLAESVREQKSESEFERYKSLLDEKRFEGQIDWTATSYELEEGIVLPIAKTGLFDRLTAKGIAKDTKFSEAAFSDMLVNDGVSELVDLTGGNVAVLQYIEEKQPEVKPLAEVKSRIVSAIKYDKARQKVKELGGLAIETVKAKKDLKEAVGEIEILTADAIARNASDVSREITRNVFEMPKPAEGEVEFAGFELVNGDYTVVGLTQVGVAEKELSEAEVANLDRSAGYVEYQQYTQYLESTATIDRAE